VSAWLSVTCRARVHGEHPWHTRVAAVAPQASQLYQQTRASAGTNEFTGKATPRSPSKASHEAKPIAEGDEDEDEDEDEE
jgi:hypothetical protein